MAYSAVPTITTGDVATASWGNTYIKDNFAAGVPDLFTTDGDVAVGTGANAAERVALLDSSNLVKRDRGGLEVALADPNADRILFWDDGAGDYAYLTVGANLTLSGTTLTGDSQAITQAVQADLEAETNEDSYAPPDRIKYSPGVAKVWVEWEQNAAHGIQASYNMASVTDGSQAGQTDHLWADDFSGVDNCPAGMAEDLYILCFEGATFAVGGLTTQTINYLGTDSDTLDNAMVVFGTQA